MSAYRAFACAALAATTAGEARVSLDVKDGAVRDVVGLLAEIGGLQVVFDPETDCKLTLRLHEVRWQTALQTTLRACGLPQEGGAAHAAGGHAVAAHGRGDGAPAAPGGAQPGRPRPARDLPALLRSRR